MASYMKYIRSLKSLISTFPDYQCIARNDAGAIQSEKIKVTVACKWRIILIYNWIRCNKLRQLVVFRLRFILENHSKYTNKRLCDISKKIILAETLICSFFGV